MECGIDFGTTFSTLAFFSELKKGGSNCLRLASSEFIPTAVFVSDEGWYSVGKRAYSDYITKKPGKYYTNPKRWIGCTAGNMHMYREKLRPEYRVRGSSSSKYTVELEGSGAGKYSYLTPVDLTYLFCKALLIEAESFTGKTVTGVVCTVPADYNSYKRSYLSSAFGKIGCPLRAFINEPTAAALAGSENSGTVNPLLAVFDFGGGTFDVSFIRFYNGVGVVLTSEGDNYLGGRDVDKKLLNIVRSRVQGSYDAATVETLISEAKEKLSTHGGYYDMPIPTSLGVETVKVTMQDLTAASEELVSRAFSIFRKAWKTLGSPLITIVLTGGSSALPLVLSTARSEKGVVKVVFEESYFRLSVALGAKLYSDILAGKSDLRLIDSLSHSLCDEIGGMVPSLIFPKGHCIPAQSSSTFTVSGNVVEYGVFEGEAPTTWLNELTFKAKSKNNSITQGRRSETATTKITLDGRISMSVNGVELVNEMVPPEPSAKVTALRYRMAREDYVEGSITAYVNQFEDIYGVRLSKEDIVNNEGAVLAKGIEENYLKGTWTD